MTLAARGTQSLTRISVGVVAPLVLSVAIVSLVFAGYQVRAQAQSMRNDLVRRSEALAETLEESVESDMARHGDSALSHTINRLGHREHIEGIGVFDPFGATLAVTTGLAPDLRGRMQTASTSCHQDSGCHSFFTDHDTLLHLLVQPLEVRDDPAGSLVFVDDASYIAAATQRIWRDTLLHAGLQAMLISLLAVVLIQWTFRTSITRIANWMRSLRIGGTERLTPPRGSSLLGPVAHEAAQMAESLDAARTAAVEEARLREAAESTWTAERLRVSVHAKLQDAPVFVISNREPVMHVRNQGQIQALVPASGVVTALEPVVTACDGTWIASGTGSADREVVDEHDRIRVPPDDPHYTLRRVWLSKDEEQGYYYGFSNEGLWPLCHIAHTRPIFRPEDWQYYESVNQKFAQVALDEMAGLESPIVLIQDYHFALLPRLIKDKRPDARVAIFWHIPWPNPEAFRICPWQRDLLKGLLGADLIGFHIQAHCNNFLESVDRALEARTDWEHFSVNRQGHLTLVRPFPISVAYTEPKPKADLQSDFAATRKKVLADLGINVRFLGVGVDRVDYTKGILERFAAIERFLDENPGYQGDFSFVQVGAPSRTNIKRYHDLVAEVHDEAQRINNRFRSAAARPIVLLERHHDHEEINRFYRAADFCLVTSLHDGMNLVAKEFVAAREDERGALILSTFTGASRELPDALVVNPYDVEQVAVAIRTAIEMSAEDQEVRMARMRRVVREQNIYRWAGNLMSALAEIRIEPAFALAAARANEG
jgi:trehalose-6-phosphate synthase